MNDLNKDIEIVEETIKHYKSISKNLYDTYLGANNEQSENYMKRAQAMENVLSELSNLKWKNEIYVKSIKSHKSAIEKQEIELETKQKDIDNWKKIYEEEEQNIIEKNNKIFSLETELETYKKIAEKPTIEFAKELNKASLVMLDGRFIGGERERVLRFYKPEDIGVDIKVNEVGKDIQLNEKIFHSGKHFLELKFYHNESIDALIHRLEHLKTL